MKEREASCTIKVYEVLFQNGEGLSGSNENSRGNKLRKGKEREEKIMNGLSKRLVSLTMATAMVFSLAAVPATDAEAASKYSIKQRSSVQATKYYDYALKGVAKTQYAKVSVSGTAKSGVTVKKGSTKITSSKKIKGTGKTLTLKVKANSSVVGKKYTLTTKIYNTKTNKKVKTLTVKNVMVNYSAKSVKLDQTAVSLKVGESATLKATMAPTKTNSKISWKTSDPAVATVKNGVVTAVSAGTATITVKTSSGKTATAKVTVEEDIKALALTATATAADTFVGTLSSAVSTNATVTVTKAGISTPVDGKGTINGTTVEFKGTANFTKGIYTITVKDGESSASAEVEVKDEYVAEIKITSTQALTNAKDTPVSGNVAGSIAYIYYDVFNQYGESMRNSTTINWTTSAGVPTVDRATGKLAVKNGTGANPFTYGSEIYVTGVYTKTGVNVSQSVKVGLTQSLDTVVPCGFINVNDPTNKLDSLPVDFSKGTYRMLYLAYDQDGNILPAKDYIAANEVTFISDQPLLVKSNFTAGTTYAIDGVEYSSVMIEPGQYVDKGGEVNITAISNKTGNKKTQNYVIGKGALLDSFSLLAPAKIVANGDQNVALDYVAKDKAGNTIENYETIVRSTNQLSITSTRGDVKVYETDEGKAAVTWSDDATDKGTYTDSDGVSIPVSITTVVVGGTSENLMMDLSDTRVPMAIKSINVNSNSDALVEGDVYAIDFFAVNDANQVVYLDQYGDDMKALAARDFFVWAQTNKYGTVEKAYYGIKADFTDTNAKFDNSDVCLTAVSGALTSLTVSANTTTAVVNDTVRYSIVSNAVSNNTASVNNWNVAGKIKTVSYTIVPMSKLSSIAFDKIGKQQLATGMAGYANGKADSTLANHIVSGDFISAVSVNTVGGVKVTGAYAGKTLRVPTGYWEVAEDSAFSVNAGKTNLDEVSANSIRYSDIYDVNSAQYVRKDGTKLLTAYVYNNAVTQNAVTQVAKISTPVVVSDAASEVTTVKFLAGESFNIQAVSTDVAFRSNGMTGVPDDHGAKKGLCVEDQYSRELILNTDYYLEYSVTDAVENKGDFAHVLNSFSVNQNGSENAGLRGAELGDTFTLTATVRDKNTSKVVSAVAKIKLGADTQANICDGSDANDKNLRTGRLGYDR